ncbi:flagellar hook-associated protein FlgK [Roseovarius salis]|uniref:flagellar hook-associated protein FlgK n=1 Tax=Roseovarius salis TaxID=3376063 RepID=UPI0037C9D224
MSISSALSNALSGLSASAKSAEVVSNNLANVLTPGYAARELALSSRGDGRGGGVLVDGITRRVDAGLLSERRQADGELARASGRAGFLTRLESLAGLPGETGSLASTITGFSQALAAAAARPEEDIRLEAAVAGARDIVAKINDLSRGIQAARMQAEERIVQAVDRANEALQRVQRLNARIVSADSAGHPTASFEDQRRVAIDSLAEIIPVRLAQRESGALAIYTRGGNALLDGRAATLTFSPANFVTAAMTHESGALNGLEIDGEPVNPSGADSPFDGAALAAHFEVRDRLAPDAQAQLDALARDLVERFQDPGLDATRAPLDAGLFTDSGARFDPVNEVGLAGRLSVNVAVDTEAGGAAWRLRDGLGATTPGPIGNAALLHHLADAIDQNAPLASGKLGATARSTSDHAAAFLSHIGQQRLAADREVTFSTANQSALAQTELGQGVDSDAQMQKLLLVEQAYNANARMITIVDEMIDTLLRI